MNNSELASDKALLEELGHRLARQRVAMELTQADLAERAGVSKRTVERVEAGESAQTATLIRILRILGLLEGLYSILPSEAPRPMELLELKGKERRRASRKRKGRPGKGWSWDDGA